MSLATLGAAVAKKKPAIPEKSDAKRYGSMVRVGDDFAEAIRKVCALSGKSAAEYTAERLLPFVLEDLDHLIAKEAKAARERKK